MVGLFCVNHQESQISTVHQKTEEYPFTSVLIPVNLFFCMDFITSRPQMFFLRSWWVWGRISSPFILFYCLQCFCVILFILSHHMLGFFPPVVSFKLYFQFSSFILLHPSISSPLLFPLPSSPSQPQKVERAEEPDVFSPPIRFSHRIAWLHCKSCL